MKAITFRARNDVELSLIADPAAGPGEVVVRVAACGLCHTDFEVLSANYGEGAFPVVPGHEYAGVVVEVGAGVTGVSEGDRVAVDPNMGCGHCRACRRGRTNLCDNLRAYGVTENGGFAGLSVVRAEAVHGIGDLEFGLAALAEPMACVLNGVDQIHRPDAETALIFGAGPMGLLMAMALGMRGVRDIAVVDIDEARLALAEGFGFRAIAAGSADLGPLRRTIDLAVDATGVPAVAGALPDYIANGGTGLYFGVCPAEARVGVAPFEVFRRQLTLTGTHSLNRNIPAALAVIADVGPGMSKLVSHRVSLDDVAAILSDRPPAGSLKVQAVLD